MMDLKLLAQLMGVSLPIFSAFYCLILLFINLYFNKQDVFTFRLSYLLAIFYVMEIVNIVAVFLSIVFRDFTIYADPVFFFTSLLIPVLLYHIFFKITRLRTAEQFNFWHYCLPFIFLIFTCICMLLIPVDFFYSTNREIEVHYKYKWYDFFLTRLIPHIRFLFSIFYLLLSFIRVFNYRKKLQEYSADTDASSLAWVYKLFFCLSLQYFFTFINHLFLAGSILDSSVIAIRSTLVVILNSILCCNIFSKNFFLLTEDIIFQEKDKISDEVIPGNPIDPVVFEEYMDAEKPYLSHDLKITDLMAPLGTNRTYLSNFINQYYGMNFSTFINTYRMHEIEALRSDPYYKDFEEEELVYTVGFKSVKSYQRTKHIISELKG